MNKPKLILHDIDGCLNPPDGEDFGPGGSGGLSENQQRSLGLLRVLLKKTGVELIPNTGRNLEDSMAMIEALVGPNCRYGLFEHGAYGWDFIENREVDLHQLAKEQGDVERVEKYEQMAVIPKLIRWYSEVGRHKLSEKCGLEPLPLRKRSNLSLECIGGLEAPVLLKALRDIVEEGFDNPHGRPLVYCHSAYFVDVLGTVHKSDGAKVLVRHLGRSEDDVLVVGDGMNDMDMFASWPQLMCPSNAFGELQELCKQRGGFVSDDAFIEATVSYLESVDS